MYWRRFAVADMPLDDDEAFGQWILDRYKEKDKLLQHFYDHGRFPPGTEGIDSGMSDDGYLHTSIHLQSPLEIGQIFVVLATAALVANVLTKFYTMFLSR